MKLKLISNGLKCLDCGKYALNEIENDFSYSSTYTVLHKASSFVVICIVISLGSFVQDTSVGEIFVIIGGLVI